MEAIIILCLLAVIGLLLQDKIVIRWKRGKNESSESTKIEHEIMGSPKPLERHSVTIAAHEGQKEKPVAQPHNFAMETKEEGFSAIPQEGLDEVFDKGPDLYEEEDEEWNSYGPPNDEDGFATGVTFDELSATQALLQQETLEPALERQVVDIVQKIQGTDLFSLLEQAMPGASQRIAKLLEKSLGSEMGSGSSALRNNYLENFDIGDFA